MNKITGNTLRASVVAADAKGNSLLDSLRRHRLALGLSLALGSLPLAGSVMAAVAPGGISPITTPVGGVVVGGTGTITQSGANTVINQQSTLLALNWQSFNLGKDASVLFNQPSFNAVALNRILDQNPSQIFGHISSNGQVFLINTHGIIFGGSAQLNVGGLVASTLDLTPSDFLSNHFNLDAHGGSAGVVNHGTIQAASGGSVSLVGGKVENDGLILANYGRINLDGADKAVLDFDGDGLVSVQITGALQQRLDADEAAVVNKGTLLSESGTVVLQAAAAKQLFTNLVNNAGVIDASGISTDGGVVRLIGNGGNTVSSGSIDASGVHGGSVQLLSDQDVTVGGSVDASGARGGGSIRVGGGARGGEGLLQAVNTTIEAGTSLNADATQSGNGGSIAVWSNQTSDIAGSFSARGGASSGNGGAIETSGEHVHIADDTRVNTLATAGQSGNWLIDPQDFTISSSGSGTITGGVPSGDVTAAVLENALGSGNVTILSSEGSNSGTGNINVNQALSWSANSLTLTAANNININASVSVSGTAGLALNPATANGSDGATTTGRIIIASAGSLSLAGTGTMTLNGALTADGTLDFSGLSTGLSLVGLAGASSGQVNLGSNTLTLTSASSNGADTFGGVISGTGALTLSGGTQKLTGVDTYTGGTTIGGGSTLQLGDGTTDGSIVGNVANGGTLVFDNTAATSFGGIISGAGGLTQKGAGTLTLTGASTYTGDTNISSGSTLALSGTGGMSSSLVNDAGTFDISGTTSGATIKSLAGAGAVTLGSEALTLGAASSVFNGVIGGTGSLEVFGGTEQLAGANTYTGGTTIDSGATLQVGNAATSGSITGNVTDNGTLVFDRSDAVSYGGVISGTGAVQQVGLGTLTLTNASTYTGGTTIGGGSTLQLGDGATDGSIVGNVANGGTLVFDNTAATSFGGIISGAGGLTQKGAGTLTLTGASTYTGDTNISSGSTLALSGTGGMSSSLVNDAGTFDISGTTSGATIKSLAGAGAVTLGSEALTLGAASSVFNGVIGGTGSLEVFGGTEQLAGANTYTGGTTIDSGATLQVGNAATSGSITGNVTDNGTLVFDRSDAVSYGGVISGTGAVQQVGLGTLTLTNASTYTGGTTIGGGSTLQLGDGTTDGSIVGNVANGGTLVFDNTAATSFGGIISGAGGLTQKGAGTLTLTGASTYTGGTTIGGGSTLQLGDGATDGSIVGNVANGGTLVFDNTAATSFGGIISGAGGLTQKGAGTLTLTGASTYTGTTVINSGSTLALTGTAGISGSAVSDAGTFDISGTTSGATIKSLAGASSGVVNLGAETLTLSNASGVFNGVIAGTGGLTLSSGTQTLTGANTYTGTTLIGSSATLQVGNAGISGSLAGDVADNGTLVFDRSDALNYGGVISGNGVVQQVGAGTLTLSNNTNTYSGGTSVLLGTLAIATDGALGGGAGGLTLDGGKLETMGGMTLNRALTIGSGGGSLLVDASTTLTLGQTVSGTGSLTESGAGVLNLGANVALTGSQTYNSAVTLGVDVTLSSSGGGDIHFASTVDGGHALTLNTGGGVAFDAAIGSGAKLASLSSTSATFSAASTLGTTGNLSITTSNGDIGQSGAFTVGGSADFSALGHAISLGNGGNAFTGAVSLSNSGNHDVVLASSGALTLGAVSVGTGSLSVTATQIGQSGALVQATGAGTASFNAGPGTIFLNNAGNDFTGTVNLTGGATQIHDQNDLTLGTLATAGLTAISGGTLNLLGNGTVGGVLSAQAVNGITINGSLTGLTGVGFTGTAPSGTGSLTGTGTVTGLGSSTFTLTGPTTGTDGGITFNGFDHVDAGTVAGAVGFDDGSKTSEGVTFGSVTHVSGSGTVANVAGGFADDTQTSSISGIVYSGFGAVTGTGGNVTGVTGNFDLGTKVSSASGINYSGFGVTTVAGSGSGATITGSNLTYTLDNSVADKGSSGGLTWTSFGNIADATGTVNFGSAGSVTGNVTAATLDYSGYGSTVSFDLSDGSGATTGVGGTWTGVATVTGSSHTDTIKGSSQTYTLTGVGAGGNGTVSWSAFEQIADSGAGTLKGTGQTYTLSGSDAGTVATWLPSGFSGIGTITDATGTVNFGTAGALTGNVTAATLDYSGYGSAVNFDLSDGSGATTGVGGTWTGVATVTGSSHGDTIKGTGKTYTLGGANMGSDGAVSWTSFENIADATGTVNFGSAGSVTGNVTAATLDYSGYGSAVNFDLSDGSGATTGVGGTWTGVATVTGSSHGDTLKGTGKTYTLSGANMGGDGAVSWTSFENIADATGTVNFGSAGSVTGNVTAATLDYSGYGSTVSFDLSDGSGATTGVGGTWTGVATVTGSSHTDTIKGSSQTYTLTGVGAGGNGTVSWSAFEQIADSGAGALNGTGQTYTLSGSDAGTVATWLPGGFSGIGTINDATGTVNFGSAGSVTGNVTAATLDYSGYGSAVSFDLSDGSGATTGVGGTWTGVATVTGSSHGDTLKGTGKTYTLSGANMGGDGAVSWTSFENIADATGTVNFGSAGSVTGNVTAATLDYSGYGSAVNFDLSDGSSATTGVGGTWTGVATVTGSSHGDTLKGTGKTYTLGGANMGSDGAVSWTSFENIADATGTVNFGSAGSVTGNVTAATLDYSGYGSAVNFDLSDGSGATTGVGGTWTGVTTVTGSSHGDTLKGTGKTYTLSGANMGGDGAVSWTSFENIADATGTVNFGSAGSVTGNVTAATLDYSGYGSTVSFDLSDGSGATTGVGGTWTGVATVTGSSHTDTIKGSSQTYTLTGVGAGGNGTVSWSAFEQIADSGAGTLKGTGQTYTLSGSNAGTVATWLPGGFSGIGTITDATGTVNLGTGGALTGNVMASEVDFGTNGTVGGNVTAPTLIYTSYASPVSFALSNGSGATTGIGGTWSGVTSVAGNGSNSNTITGSNQTYTLTGVGAGGNGTVSWSAFARIADSGAGTLNGTGQTYTLSGSNAGTVAAWLPGGFSGIGTITDATGTVNFGTAGALTGNVTAATLDYSGYGSAVSFDLSDGSGATTGVGGTWTGVATVTGSSQGDTIKGSNQTYTLNGVNTGSNGTVGWTSFENIADSGAGTILAANQHWALSGGNQGTLTDLSGGFSGIANLTDTGSGYFLMHSGGDGALSGNLDAGSQGTLDYTGYTTAAAVHLSGTGSTGVGGTIKGITSIVASNDLAVDGTASDSLGITVSAPGAVTTLGGLSVGSNLSVSTSGSIQQGTGAVTVGGTTSLLAGGAIHLLDPGNDFAGNVSLAGTDLALASKGDLTVASAIGSAGGSVSLQSGGGLATSGVVSGDNVSLIGATGLVLGGDVTAGQVATLNGGSGNIVQSSGVITAGNLTGSAGGSATLTGANRIGTLGNFTASGFSLTNAQALTVAGAVNGGTGTSTLATTAGDLTVGGSVAGGAVGLDAAGNLAINGDVDSGAGTATLTAGGAISEGASSVVTAGSLTGSAAGSAMLTGANRIGTLGNFTASGFSLTNAQALTVAGAVNGGTGTSTLATTAGDLTVGGSVAGGAVGLDAAGNLAINGDVDSGAGTATLTAGGAISEGASGVVSAGSLTGSAAGSATLTGANRIGTLGNFAANGFSLTNAQALTVAGAVNGGPGASTLTTTAGDLTVGGSVAGGTVGLDAAGNLAINGGVDSGAGTATLTAGGAISEGASGVVTAGLLTGQSAGSTTLDPPNMIATLGSFTANGFTLLNGETLTVVGPVHGGSGIMLQTTSGGLVIDGAMSAQLVSLLSAGGIDGDANGAITATTLTGSAAGPTTLGSASQFMGNHVDVLGGFNSPAGFSFTNAQTLTLASVGGSAYTVNAGTSALYLGVSGGDLLQQGTTWSYDGTGTWAASGKIGTLAAPIYVTGVGDQVVSLMAPPAYFYAVDAHGNLLPVLGAPSVNVPTSALTSKAQNGNNHGDAYIDPSIINANYRSFGIVPSGILLPPDQQACQPGQPATADCPADD